MRIIVDAYTRDQVTRCNKSGEWWPFCIVVTEPSAKPSWLGLCLLAAVFSA